MATEIESLAQINAIASVSPEGRRPEGETEAKDIQKNSNLHTQVKVTQQRAPRRIFTNAYKLQILNAFDACTNGTERGALLRKEGLYYARLITWRKQLQGDQLALHKTPKSILANQQLTRENARIKRKLAQAEAIIELQKKISELFSNHVLDQDTSEMKS